MYGGGLVTKSCPCDPSDLSNPGDCGLSGCFVHGISQARILEWPAISFSWESSQCIDWTQVSSTAGRFFIADPPGKPMLLLHSFFLLFTYFGLCWVLVIVHRLSLVAVSRICSSLWCAGLSLQSAGLGVQASVGAPRGL